MQCKEVEGVLEQEQIAPLPEEARAHVAVCTACQNLVSDFNAIIAAAERMPAEITPPERVWISLRAQLEAEGIIKEQPAAIATEAAPWWQSFAALLRGRSLATAGVGLLIAAAALFQIQSGNEYSKAAESRAARTGVPMMLFGDEQRGVERGDRRGAYGCDD